MIIMDIVINGSTKSNKINRATITIISIKRSISDKINCPEAKEVSFIILLINFDELLST